MVDEGPSFETANVVEVHGTTLKCNADESCRFDTRRTQLKSTDHSCVQKGGLTEGLVQGNGRRTSGQAISMPFLCGT